MRVARLQLAATREEEWDRVRGRDRGQVSVREIEGERVTVTRCNTLQHAATRCNAAANYHILQHSMFASDWRHKMPYLYRSFSAKEPYEYWLFCGKRPATGEREKEQERDKETVRALARNRDRGKRKNVCITVQVCV